MFTAHYRSLCYCNAEFWQLWGSCTTILGGEMRWCNWVHPMHPYTTLLAVTAARRLFILYRIYLFVVCSTTSCLKLHRRIWDDQYSLDQLHSMTLSMISLSLCSVDETLWLASCLDWHADCCFCSTLWVNTMPLQLGSLLLRRVGYCDVMYMLSALMNLLVPSWTDWSLTYMLKRVGERTLPCGRPFFYFTAGFG